MRRIRIRKLEDIGDQEETKMGVISIFRGDSKGENARPKAMSSLINASKVIGRALLRDDVPRFLQVVYTEHDHRAQ